MPDIYHLFQVNASPSKVFEAISSPSGLDAWWTKKSRGNPRPGNLYELDFGPGYVWHALVSKCETDKILELKMLEADADWMETKVGFTLDFRDGATNVDFYHCGWKENNEHYRISSFCWAMYLRILKRYVEYGEQIAYEKRLEV